MVKRRRKRINAPLLRFAPQKRPLNPRMQPSRKGQIDLLNQLNQSNEILVTTLLKKRIGIKRKIRRRIVASLRNFATLIPQARPVYREKLTLFKEQNELYKQSEGTLFILSNKPCTLFIANRLGQRTDFGLLQVNLYRLRHLSRPPQSP